MPSAGAEIAPSFSAPATSLLDTPRASAHTMHSRGGALDLRSSSRRPGSFRLLRPLRIAPAQSDSSRAVQSGRSFSGREAMA